MAIKSYNYEEIITDKKKFDEVFDYIKKYGSHTMAYSILQPKMVYFIEEEMGLIAYSKYKEKRQRCFVLADPLCKEENLEGILKNFLEHFPKSSFIQVSSRTAKELKKLKYYSTPMGIETKIDIEKFSLDGERKKKLRNNIRNCKKELIVYEEGEKEELNLSQLQKISEDWLKKKSNKEIKFLTKPLIKNKEPELRIFFAIKDKNVVGFIIFNPIYLDKKIIGYTADITRTLKEAPRGTGDYILYLALKKFRREGHPLLNLGLSPFSDIHKDKLGLHDKLTLGLLKFLYKAGEHLYHFKGLNEHKKQYEGEENQVYFSHKNKFAAYQVYQLFKICNVI